MPVFLQMQWRLCNLGSLSGISVKDCVLHCMKLDLYGAEDAGMGTVKSLLVSSE